MKQLFTLVILLTLFQNLTAQNFNDTTSKVILGYYKAGPADDSLKIMVDKNLKKTKRAYIEYFGTCRINEDEYLANFLIGAKKGHISELVEALIYLRNKSIEWNSILKKRNIEEYEKVFKEVDFPRLDIIIRMQNDVFSLWNNKHYIDHACFIKKSNNNNYLIKLNIVGVKAIDQDNLIKIHVNNYLELEGEDIDRLIRLLNEASNLCEVDNQDDIDDLLIE